MGNEIVNAQEAISKMRRHNYSVIDIVLGFEVLLRERSEFQNKLDAIEKRDDLVKQLNMANDVIKETKNAISIVETLLNYFNPAQLASDKEDQWWATHDEMNRLTSKLKDYQALKGNLNASE